MVVHGFLRYTAGILDQVLIAASIATDRIVLINDRHIAFYLAPG